MKKALLHSTLIVPLALAGGTGCGDDDPDTQPDAGDTMIDADTGGEPDGAPPPDSGPGEVALEDPEGGQVNVEYIRFSQELQDDPDFDAAAENVRVSAYFMKNQMPEALEQAEFNKCTHYSEGLWPQGQGEQREYVDVGDITVSGAAQDIVLSPVVEEGKVDESGRPHDIQYALTEYSTNNTADYGLQNGTYDVSFAGSDDYPAQAWEDVLHMPAEFTVTEPAFQFLTLDDQQDLNITWEVADSDNLPGDARPGEFAVTMLVDFVTGKVVQFCPSTNDGEFTIPQEDIAEFSAEYNSGLLFRGVGVHNLVRYNDEQGNNDRRIDMLTLNCYVQYFEIGQG